MSRKGMMIVLNDIVRDSRVLKMAAAMRTVYRDFVLIGVRAPSQLDEPPVNEVVNKLHCVFFAKYSADLEQHPNETKAQFLFRRDVAGINNLVEEVTSFSNEFRPDCIHTHDMYTLPIGRALKSAAHKRGDNVTWIHDVHEFAAGCTHIPEVYQNLALQFESEHIQHADTLLTVTKELASELTKRYNKLPALHVIFNTPPAYPKAAAPIGDIRSKLNLGHVPLAVYSGQVKPKRGVEKMIPVLRNTPDLHLAILSNNRGVHIDGMKEEAEKQGVRERMHWHPYVPHDQVSSFLASADVGVIPIENYGNAMVALPNKLFEYTFAGLPVISQNLTAISTFFDNYNVGSIADFDRPNEATKTIADVIASNDARQEAKKERIRIIADYAWEVQQRKLQSIYLRAAGFKNSRVIDQVTGIERKEAKFNILHGVTEAAGQPRALTKELNKLPDLHVQDLQVVISKFGHEPDLAYPVGSAVNADDMTGALRAVIDAFDIFHLHARTFLFDPNEAAFPAGLDLLMLKAAGKKVLVHFRGTEARLQSQFKANSPYHYVDDDEDGTIEAFPEHAKQRLISLASAVADRVLVVDPEIQSYVPNSQVVERAIDLELWPFVGVSETERPLIVHAPSRRGVKGTQFIIEAAERLKENGHEFDFQLVENLPNSEARKIYERADIIVDQLRIGWYGVLAVEAMALGKPVVTYIRDDLLHHFAQERPFAVANPDTIEPVLEKLITDYSIRSRLSKIGREYCERTHDVGVVAAKLNTIYREVMDKPKLIEPGQVLQHIAEQSQIIDETKAMLRTAERKSAKLARIIAEEEALRTTTNYDRIIFLLKLMRDQGPLSPFPFAFRRVVRVFKPKNASE